MSRLTVSGEHLCGSQGVAHLLPMEPAGRFVGSLTCNNGHPTGVPRKMALLQNFMAQNSMAEEFACPKCSSQSVVYPDVLADDKYVTCRACGTLLATVLQFRRLIEGHVPSGAPFSGC
jgi:ribosomal protein S27E